MDTNGSTSGISFELMGQGNNLLSFSTVYPPIGEMSLLSNPKGENTLNTLTWKQAKQDAKNVLEGKEIKENLTEDYRMTVVTVYYIHTSGRMFTGTGLSFVNPIEYKKGVEGETLPFVPEGGKSGLGYKIAKERALRVLGLQMLSIGLGSSPYPAGEYFSFLSRAILGATNRNHMSRKKDVEA